MAPQTSFDHAPIAMATNLNIPIVDVWANPIGGVSASHPLLLNFDSPEF